jgi:Zn finger protein HypA/HybF involved in hydrogenase expression
MKCERCESDKEAEFRVVSDVLDIKVCPNCASEARKVGTSLEIVEIDKAKNERAASKAEARGYPAVTVSDCAH